MRPIRQGDGTGLSVPGFSEVRKGDGTVVWSAGGDIPDSGVDDFEEILYEDQGRTLSDYYGGETGGYLRQQSIVYEGNYALEATADVSGIMDDGGDFPLSTDTTWEFYQYHTASTADGGWGWMSQNESGRSSHSCYVVNIRSNNDDIIIRRWDDGDSTILEEASVSVPENEWMRGEVEHLDDGSITFTLFDSNETELAQASATDTTYSSGGHGFTNYDPAIVWDNVREI